MYQFKLTEGYTSLFHKEVQLLTNKVTGISLNLSKIVSFPYPSPQAGNASNL